MSIKTYLKCVLNRLQHKNVEYVPFATAMLDIVLREEHHMNSYVTLRVKPKWISMIRYTAVSEWEKALVVLRDHELLEEETARVKILSKAVHLPQGRMLGTGESFRSLRSKMISIDYLIGPGYAAFTTNPGDHANPYV